MTRLWWQIWFDIYRAFAVNYADMATQTGAQALILGGDWIGPALPNGTLFDGNQSGVPNDAETRWLAILNEVRAHFRGQILWAMPYTAPNLVTPSFIAQTDGVYLLISGNLSGNLIPIQRGNGGRGRLPAGQQRRALAIVDRQTRLPGLCLSFINGGGANCLPANNGACLNWTALSQPND